MTNYLVFEADKFVENNYPLSDFVNKNTFDKYLTKLYTGRNLRPKEAANLQVKYLNNPTAWKIYDYTDAFRDNFMQEDNFINDKYIQGRIFRQTLETEGGGAYVQSQNGQYLLYWIEEFGFTKLNEEYWVSKTVRSLKDTDNRRPFKNSVILLPAKLVEAFMKQRNKLPAIGGGYAFYLHIKPPQSTENLKIKSVLPFVDNVMVVKSLELPEWVRLPKSLKD